MIMAMQAEAVDILVRKARFEPNVALGVAEAMGVSIDLAQLVTVPVLDARLQELKAELKTQGVDFKAELKTREAEIKAEIKRQETELKAEIRKQETELKAEMRKQETELKAEIKLQGAQLTAAMEKTKAELVRWVFLTMLGNVALGAFASQVLKAFAN